MQIMKQLSNKSEHTQDNIEQMVKTLKKIDLEPQEDHYTDSASCFDFQVSDPQFLYPINSNYYEIQKNPIDIYSLFGASNMGRKSSIYWANRINKYPIIKIDINLYSTQLQFIQRLATLISEIVQVEQLKRQMIVDQQVNFDAITSFITTTKKKILIVIDNAERLSQPKRQIILYTLLEWMKKDIKQYIGLYILLKNIKFLETLEKRVKSRYTSKYLFYNKNQKDKILDLLTHRFYLSKNIFLQQTMINFIHSPDFVKILEIRIGFGGKITQFLLIIKELLYSIDFQKLKRTQDKNKYLSQLANQTLKQIKPNTLIDIFRDLSYPQLILMALLKNMIRKNLPLVNFNQAINYYAEVKQNALSTIPGSPFNYSTAVLQRGFRKLIELRLISIDDSHENQVNSPITVMIHLDEIEKTYLEIKSQLSQFIRKILAYTK